MSSATGRACLETVPFGTPSDDVLAVIDRDGGVILSGVLDGGQIERINGEIEPHMEGVQLGTTAEDEWWKEFHGPRTKRLTDLVNISPTLRDGLFANGQALDYASAMFRDTCDTFWLTTAQVIEIHPGQTAQPLHRDQGNYPVFNRYGPDAPEVIVNFLIALNDSTEEVGATRVIPASHRWADFGEVGTQAMTIPAELPAGSALLISGKTVHGGGANLSEGYRRRVVSMSYNAGFLVPEEAYPFVVSLETARQLSPTMQQLIGFRSFHQYRHQGGSLWQHQYSELADHLGLDQVRVP